MKNKISFTEIIKWALAVVIAVVIAIAGSIFHVKGWYHELAFSIIMITTLVFLIVGTIISVVMKKRFIDTIDRENLQNQLLKKRENAAEIAQNLIDELKKIIRRKDFCSVVVLAFVCVINFCFFAVVGGSGGGVALPIIVGTCAGLAFIRTRKIKINEKNQDGYLSESEFPLIYDTARRAANKIGWNGKIKIALKHDFNVGIVGFSDGCIISIGTYVLDVMSNDELYNIFLHEFAHMLEKNNDVDEVMTYAEQMNGDGISAIVDIPYIYFNAKFAFEYFSYRYVCSLMNEDTADSAMREHGDPQTAASMLIKLKFFELYDWEQGTYDRESIFAPESLVDDPLRREIKAFKDRMEHRNYDWIRLIDNEIISRSATHPTIKMRIDALGITELKILPKSDNDEYLAEAEKAIIGAEDILKKNIKNSYKLIRQRQYLSHVEMLDEWENEGRPIKTLNYQNILLAMLECNRSSDFVNTCCQIIEKIPEPGNYFAHHMYGIYLLRCYDEKGIDHLYKAIELNHNNWREAMDHIGRYACVVGKQERLDVYRERVLALAKKQEDVYEKMISLNPNDTILPEHLPDGMLEGLLRYVRDLDRGRCVIGEIYIVRKIIDKDHFVSCVIVQPRRNASPDHLAFVMDSIYQFLDKSTEWQFSLFDMRFVARVLYPKIKKSRVYRGIIA